MRFILLFLLLLLSLTPSASARAGGGGHGGGGHSSGGHSSGGHSSGGSHFFSGSYSTRSHSTNSSSFDSIIPWFAVLIPGALIAVLMIGLVKNARRAALPTASAPRLLPRSAINFKSHETRALLDQLAAQDPLFNPQTLEPHIRSTFFALQKAWQARDYAPVQPLLTPLLFAQHSAKLAQMRQRDQINILRDLRIDALDFVHVHFTPNLAERSVTLLLTARATDFIVDNRTGRLVEGSRFPKTFQEFWTFRRQPDSLALDKIEQSWQSAALGADNSVAP